MSICQALLAEFEHEAQTTRKFLERIPEDKLTWKPHEKSMTAGQLALHIATVPQNVLQMSLEDETSPPDLSRPRPEPNNVAEVLAALEQSTAMVKKTLPTIDDERMHRTLRITAGGQEVLAMPRVVFLRSIMLNHWYQHRGQFGVYLRLMGAKVPSSYGPSGDEQPDFSKRK